MLDLAILGLLNEGPLHGYELKRQLAEYGFWQVSFGSLYPAMRRLEKSGHIEADRVTGRRKEYRITPPGEAEFRKLLVDASGDADEDRAFQLRLAFFRYLDPESRLSVLERRRDRLVERLAAARRALRERGARAKETLDRYAVALMERGVTRTEDDIAWLDELIAAEQDNGHPPRNETRRRWASDTEPGGNAWAK